MNFSQRHGYTPIKNVIQFESIDDALRNALWSASQIYYWDAIQSDHDIMGARFRLSNYGNENLRSLCQKLWLNFYKLPLDTLPDDWGKINEYLRKFFFSCKWYEVYDFVEFVAQSHPENNRNAQFVEAANIFLEREVSAYRFVDGRIVKITAKEEIESIEAASTNENGPVQEHLERALQLLADRRTPDYRNSIKESISAVEAAVKSISGTDSGTLGDLLKRLARKHPIHPALEGAFTKLYGYTSDAKGIRHALMDDDRVTFDEAKFMLVACSAFVSYVRGVSK
jgi:hypothetical protein